jgi:hypothetical protein
MPLNTALVLPLKATNAYWQWYADFFEKQLFPAGTTLQKLDLIAGNQAI